MPVYYIEQTEGPKASAARELFEARKSGDYTKMAAIYKNELGSVSESAQQEIETENLCWWIFNAAGNIKQNHAVTVAQVRKRAGYNCEIEGKHFAQVCATLAQERHGGTWRTVYEY